MKPFLKNAALACVTVCVLSASTARADQAEICRSLTFLAKTEYARKTAEGEMWMKSERILPITTGARLFISRLTANHLNYIKAARLGQLDYSRLAEILNEEVAERIRRMGLRVYAFDLSTGKASVFLLACSTPRLCIRVELLEESDFQKSILRQARYMADFPEKTEADFVGDLLPLACRESETKPATGAKVESEGSKQVSVPDVGPLVPSSSKTPVN